MYKIISVTNSAKVWNKNEYDEDWIYRMLNKEE